MYLTLESPMERPVSSIASAELPDVVTSSEDYARRFSGATGRWMLSVQERAVVSMLSRSSPREVLDVGGGHGQLAEPLLNSGYDVTILGSSEACSQRLKPLEARGCRFAIGNLLDIPFPDKSFDAVLCFRLVSHCDDWGRLVDELCRVARRTVVLDFPPLRSFNALYPLLFSLKRKLEGNTRTFSVFEEAEIRDRFARNGFAPKSRVGQFFFPMVIHRSLRSAKISSMMEVVSSRLGLNELLGSPVIAEMERQ